MFRPGWVRSPDSGKTTVFQRTPVGFQRSRPPDILHRIIETTPPGARASRPQAALLAVVLGQDVLLGRGQQSQPFRRRAGGPPGPIEPVELAESDLVLLQHYRHRFRLIERRLAGAAALGVGGQGAFQFVGKAQVVDHQAARYSTVTPSTSMR